MGPRLSLDTQPPLLSCSPLQGTCRTLSGSVGITRLILGSLSWVLELKSFSNQIPDSVYKEKPSAKSTGRLGGLGSGPSPAIKWQ